MTVARLFSAVEDKKQSSRAGDQTADVFLFLGNVQPALSTADLDLLVKHLLSALGTVISHPQVDATRGTVLFTLVNGVKATGVVRGPQAEDKQESEAFANLFGGQHYTQVRRFADGSILECFPYSTIESAMMRVVDSFPGRRGLASSVKCSVCPWGRMDQSEKAKGSNETSECSLACQCASVTSMKALVASIKSLAKTSASELGEAAKTEFVDLVGLSSRVFRDCNALSEYGPIQGTLVFRAPKSGDSQESDAADVETAAHRLLLRTRLIERFVSAIETSSQSGASSSKKEMSFDGEVHSVKVLSSQIPSSAGLASVSAIDSLSTVIVVNGWLNLQVAVIDSKVVSGPGASDVKIHEVKDPVVRQLISDRASRFLTENSKLSDVTSMTKAFNRAYIMICQILDNHLVLNIDGRFESMNETDREIGNENATDSAGKTIRDSRHHRSQANGYTDHTHQASAGRSVQEFVGQSLNKICASWTSENCPSAHALVSMWVHTYASKIAHAVFPNSSNLSRQASVEFERLESVGEKLESLRTSALSSGSLEEVTKFPLSTDMFKYYDIVVSLSDSGETEGKDSTSSCVSLSRFVSSVRALVGAMCCIHHSSSHGIVGLKFHTTETASIAAARKLCCLYKRVDSSPGPDAQPPRYVLDVEGLSKSIEKLAGKSLSSVKVNTNLKDL